MTTQFKPITSVWRPILDGADASLARKILTGIAGTLANSPLLRFCGGSLSKGTAGGALFFAYLGQLDGFDLANDRSDSWLSYSAREIAGAAGPDARSDPQGRTSPPYDFRLYSGATGISWTISHLERLGIKVPGAVDFRTTLDTHLLARLVEGPWPYDYDLVSGLVGYAVYALERMENDAGPALLQAIVDQLEERAVVRKDGVTWLTPLNSTSATAPDEVNLGLAHGIPGVIAILAQICRLGIGMPGTRQLLDDAVRWLLAQQNDNTVNAAFESTISANEPVPLTERRGSRVAWCYGDLGLSAALYGAALAVDHASLASHALSIARRAAGRSLADSGVKDAGLCHGTAGIGHIFNRLYQATREPLFLEAARIWLQRTLKLYQPDHGFGGYRAWIKPPNTPEGEWLHVPGLLMGTAGIGLALVSALTSTAPLWDGMLLVTLPTRSDIPLESQDVVDIQ